eukprot:gene1765-2432_t
MQRKYCTDLLDVELVCSWRHGYSNHTRIQVEKAFVMKEFKEGDAIIGDKVEARFHVIATGEAIHMTNTANRRVLTTGMCVGEDALSAHSEPSMDCRADTSEAVVARTAVETWSIDQHCFKRVLNRIPLKGVCAEKRAFSDAAAYPGRSMGFGI